VELKLYSLLADWWPLISPPADYAEEAAIYERHLLEYGDQPARTLVEFGSGGGNNASHLKRRFEMTLVDASPGMLAVSRKLNPDCDHIEGDMRNARLGREFDRVFIHDAICYMTTTADLRRAFDTAFVHCRPGGAALFAPDFVRETFCPATEHGGEDDGLGGLRYLEWVWDPDPSDTTYFAEYAYLLREADGSVRVEHDRHLEGLFPRAVWMRLLADAGFEPRNAAFEHPDWGELQLFAGIRPR
jgi:SAM-dependent methyltransferase